MIYEIFNPNKAGLFEGSYFWMEGGLFDPLYISRRTNLILIKLYAIVKQLI